MNTAKMVAEKVINGGTNFVIGSQMMVSIIIYPLTKAN